MKIKVGSRDSKLAVVQSEMIIKQIGEAFKDCELELVTMKTTGDKILNKTLDKIGGKGLFVKELDEALESRAVDITVHSFKDVPMEVKKELPIIAVSKREDPRDVLILPEGASEIDFSKPVGCSSKRRQIQLEEIFPGVTIAPIRGNVQTRLAKLDRGEFSATILAYAGIKRLGLESRVSRVFSEKEMLPAACQGILAIQGREDFPKEIANEINDSETMAIAKAERAYVRTLDGGCSSPACCHAVINGEEMTITGMYVNSKEQVSKKAITCKIEESEALAINLAKEMKQEGETA